MDGYRWEEFARTVDETRDVVVAGTEKETVQFCVEHFMRLAADAIEKRGKFFVALAGGSTPQALFRGLVEENRQHPIDWKQVHLFWSDERAVPPDHKDSNYQMAMEAGFKHLPLPAENVYRMVAETAIEEHALKYEKLIEQQVPEGRFDLVMLGIGEDGHTASLFPKTHALYAKERLVVANYVPEKQVWRMTLTYDCINQARHIVLYIMGRSKAAIVHKVFSEPENSELFPVQGVGSASNKALFILDQEAARLMFPPVAS